MLGEQYFITLITLNIISVVLYLGGCPCILEKNICFGVDGQMDAFVLSTSFILVFYKLLSLCSSF